MQILNIFKDNTADLKDIFYLQQTSATPWKSGFLSKKKVEAQSTAHPRKDVMWVISDLKGPLPAWRRGREEEEVIFSAMSTVL